jgi:peroxiredoxin Q/BCP
MASIKQRRVTGMLDSNIPDFSMPATSGQTFSLNEQLGKIVVIYFYPKDSTPGCTTESASSSVTCIRNLLSAGAEVIGISRDSIKSHLNFKAKLEPALRTGSDSDEKVCTLFGVMKMKNMYGKQVRGVERSTFVIDKNGVFCASGAASRCPATPTKCSPS